MDPRTRSIAVGAVALIILASLLGSIYYLSRVSKNNNPTESIPDSLSSLPVSSSSPSAAPLRSGSSNDNSNKVYINQNILFSYPKNWGLLTCSNSGNFELDPTSGADVRDIVCDWAVKPVTIMTSGAQACQGDKVTLGSLQVTKSKTTSANGDTNYRWCVSIANKNLDITHRVSPSGTRATSKEDFSSVVEDFISKLQPAPQGS